MLSCSMLQWMCVAVLVGACITYIKYTCELNSIHIFIYIYSHTHIFPYRVSHSLVEVHRAMAVQEGRRRRDRLALDCVRLGKLVPRRVVRSHVDYILPSNLV